MDDHMDEKTRRQLLEAAHRMKLEAERMRRKREDRLWAQITVPCRLEDVLTPLTKTELDGIRQTLALPNISNLKKQDLILELVRLIPEEAGKVFARLDNERYDLVKKVAKDGCYEVESLSLLKAEFFRDHGVLFPGELAGKRVLVMPEEVVSVFQKMDGPELSKYIKRNTEWVRLTNGLLYFYGVLKIQQLMDMLFNLTGQAPDWMEYYYVLREAQYYYGEIREVDRWGYCHDLVDDPEQVVMEQKARPDIEYRRFSKAQLLKAGAGGFVEENLEFKRLVGFLSDHWEMSMLEAEEIAVECVAMIREDEKFSDVLQVIAEQVDFPSMDVLQQLTMILNDLSNHTRRWILKGHTPDEIFQGEKKHLQPLPSTPFVNPARPGKVIDIRDHLNKPDKVGRNAPCPCGSGKKYKHCCGSVL